MPSSPRDLETMLNDLGPDQRASESELRLAMELMHRHQDAHADGLLSPHQEWSAATPTHQPSHRLLDEDPFPQRPAAPREATDTASI